MYNPTTVREKNFSYTCFDYVTYMYTKSRNETIFLP